MSFITRRGSPWASSDSDIPATLLGWLAWRMAAVMELTSIQVGGGGSGAGALRASSLLIADE